MIHTLKIFFLATFIYVLFSGCQSAASGGNENSSSTRWEKIGPGGGGATFIPTFAYNSPEDFLIRCDMTGSYLTHDGGKSYTQFNYPNGASAYAFDPNDKNTIYIGSSTLNRSTDGGKSWEQLLPIPSQVTGEMFSGDHASYNIEIRDTTVFNPEFNINAIRVDPVNPQMIFVGMGPNLLYSSDNGKTWNKKQVGERIMYLYTNGKGAKDELYVFTSSSIHIFNKKTDEVSTRQTDSNIFPVFSWSAGTVKGSGDMIIYALHHDATRPIDGEFGYTDVWSSTDGGTGWTRAADTTITNKSGITPSYSMIACAEEDASQAYVVCNRYEQRDNGKLRYWYGALNTNDAGNNWNWVWKGGGGSGQYGVKDGIGVANLKDAWTEEAFGGEYIRLMDVGVFPADGNVAIVTDWYRTMKTSDGGKTWEQIYSEPQANGTFKSRGLDVTTAYGVHFDPFDKNHIAISYTDIGYHHSYDGGKTWKRSVSGVPADWVNTCYWMEFDPQVKGKVWSVWSNLHDFPRGKMTRSPNWKSRARGGVCVSLDGGKTWKPSIEGMGPNSPATSIIIDKSSPANKRTLYTSVYSKGVYKSVDDGKTWTLKNSGIVDNTHAFELTLAPNGDLYLTVSAVPAHTGGNKGRDFYSGAVYKSTDKAETWTKLNVTSGLLFPNGIAVDPSNANRVYLACWSDIQLSDLVGGDVTRATGGNELLKMKGGIFLSEDGGNTWKSIFDEKQYVYDVTIDEKRPETLYCNTFNGAAYMSSDRGRTWNKIKGYDFHWGQRVVVDEHAAGKIYITTFGSSVWHGKPIGE